MGRKETAGGGMWRLEGQFCTEGGGWTGMGGEGTPPTAPTTVPQTLSLLYVPPVCTCRPKLAGAVMMPTPAPSPIPTAH